MWNVILRPSFAKCKISPQTGFLQNLTIKCHFVPIYQLTVALICKWKYIWKIRENRSSTHLWWLLWQENVCYQIKSVGEDKFGIGVLSYPKTYATYTRIILNYSNSRQMAPDTVQAITALAVTSSPSSCSLLRSAINNIGPQCNNTDFTVVARCAANGWHNMWPPCNFKAMFIRWDLWLSKTFHWVSGEHETDV